MFDSLGDRIKAYENVTNFELMRRCPIIIRVDGISFSRFTRKLKKPYEPLFLEAMAQTMLHVASEIGGCVFGYQQSDEITFVLKNDQSLDTEPWYANRIQKICSSTASMTSIKLQKNLSNLDLPLIGDGIFDCRVFAVPTIGEAVNCVLWRQSDAIRNAISSAAYAILCKNFGKKTALNMLHKVTTKDKLELMTNECGIDFHEEYPASYRYGVSVYKVPTLIMKKDGSNSTRKKWILDWDLPVFSKDRDFIYNIIHSGSDVIRANIINSNVLNKSNALL